MLRTKNIITRFEELDESWAFRYYLKLDEVLEGQSLQIHTPFKEEKTASFFLFYEGRYFFKCFATNRGGDVYELVKFLFKFSNKADAINKVWYDYEQFLNGNGTTWSLNNYSNVQYTEKKRFRVNEVEMRKWNNDDKNYWTKYHIRSKLLEEYNVAALGKIIMTKMENGVTSEYIIQRPLMYGFHKNNGELYKIYQPGNDKAKYLKVRNYIQGTDQLSTERPNLLITKALKDIMGFRTLELKDWDVISPDSENDVLPVELISAYKKRYKKIVTLFDNDAAGETARIAYKETHGIDPILFNMGQKDLTDSLAANDFCEVKKQIISLLN